MLRLILAAVGLIPGSCAAAQVVTNAFEKDILAFEAADRTNAPSAGAILLVGDSQFTRWKTVHQDLPEYRIINRGFGGSKMTDLLFYTDRIVLRYKPRMIVVNEGGNDIHSGRTPEQLLADIQKFVSRVRAALPDVPIAFSGLTPSPARWSETDTRVRFNQLLRGYLATGKNLIYLDLFDSYLGADGKPREELFVEDKLHHSTAGYAVRIRIMRPILGAPDFQDEAPGKALRIAVVQQDANPGKPEENRNKALRFARQALEQGAEVILFHEELLVGYVKDLRELAEPVDGPTTRAFQSLLRGSQALVIYGLTERDGDKYFISATVVSADGVLTNYHKTHLWWKDEGLRHEPTFYQPGVRLVTFNVRDHKCGLMICYDGDFPEMTRAYANLGCSVLFWLNNRGSRGHAEVKDLAYRNSMIVATLCCCGTDESGHVCRGGSNITDATGKLLSEIWDQEGIIVTTVLPDKVPALRAENPWYRGQRPDLYR